MLDDKQSTQGPPAEKIVTLSSLLAPKLARGDAKEEVWGLQGNVGALDQIIYSSRYHFLLQDCLFIHYSITIICLFSFSIYFTNISYFFQSHHLSSSVHCTSLVIVSDLLLLNYPSLVLYSNLYISPLHGKVVSSCVRRLLARRSNMLLTMQLPHENMSLHTLLQLLRLSQNASITPWCRKDGLQFTTKTPRERIQ